MERRRTGQPGREGEYLAEAADGSVPDPVQRWQREAHTPGIYDLEVDTSVLDPEACATVIRQHLESGIKTPTAFQQLGAQSLC
jgi:chloramphenicol 3-O phosphotransferase